MKLQLFNDLGIPFNLKATDSVKVLFPYHSGVIEKGVDILDDETGMIQVVFTDFELQGLKEGANQTFWAKAIKGNQLFTFEFPKALTVEIRDGRKAIDTK